MKCNIYKVIHIYHILLNFKKLIMDNFTNNCFNKSTIQISNLNSLLNNFGRINKDTNILNKNRYYNLSKNYLKNRNLSSNNYCKKNMAKCKIYINLMNSYKLSIVYHNINKFYSNYQKMCQ